MRGGASLVKATVREEEEEEEEKEEEEANLLVAPVRRPPISRRLTEGNW